jgi:hypothetical protein
MDEVWQDEIIETERLIEVVETTPDLPAAKAAVLRSALLTIREAASNALRLLEAVDSGMAERPSNLVQPGSESSIPAGIPASFSAVNLAGDRVVEGVFDGEGMVGSDGKTYAVPANYASKSKLVEGDLLKLTIGARGNFIYKQIGPIERQRLIGTVTLDQETGQFLVLSGGRSWKVLRASITYFHGEVADEAVILVPKNAPSKWAAVENVIKADPTRLGEAAYRNVLNQPSAQTHNR